MSSIICPTVLASNPHEYREQMARIASFAQRIQIDLMDGEFAPSHSVALDRVWWDDGLQADIHLMYQRPLEYLGQLIQMRTALVIIHFEASAPHQHMAIELQRHGIRAGIALLKETPISAVSDILPAFDHLHRTSGDLGQFGGQADLGLLHKVAEARAIKPDIEIGGDGGINSDNARALADGGINVLNIGGFIQKSSDPQDAYATLETLVGTNTHETKHDN